MNVVKMSVIGCADLSAPANGWMRQTGSDVIMGCNGSAVNWRMICDHNRWVVHGHAGQNCTPGDLISYSNLFLPHFRCVFPVFTDTPRHMTDALCLSYCQWRFYEKYLGGLAHHHFGLLGANNG